MSEATIIIVMTGLLVQQFNGSLRATQIKLSAQRTAQVRRTAEIATSLALLMSRNGVVSLPCATEACERLVHPDILVLIMRQPVLAGCGRSTRIWKQSPV